MTVQTTLPAGWRWARMDDICILGRGRVISDLDIKAHPGTYPVYSSQTVNQGIFGYLDTYDFDGEYATWTTDGANAGTVFYRNGKFNCTNVCGTLKARIGDIDMMYVSYALGFVAKAEVFIASGNPKLMNNVVARIEIPIPPLTEQQRIAARLNEQMTAVSQARQAAEAQLRAARELTSAYLREVFEGQDVQKWPMQHLAEVSAIGAGITLGRKLFNVQTRKVPYLRVANVKDGFLDLSDVYKIDATDADVAKCTLKYGDLLLTEGGDPDKLGRGTFWEEQIPECLHQNHIFRVRFDQGKFSARFMAYQVGSPYGKAYFLAHAKQTTGIATINQKVLGNFPLLIPPFDDQEKIANTIKERLAEAETLKQSLETQLAEINQFPSALLRRAFNGEL